jgi:CRP-like cAMP-binding protein
LRKLDESLLAPLAPFAQMEGPQLRAILDQASSRRFDPGAAVFREDETAENFFLLLDGTIRVVRITPDGEQITSIHISPGQLFGFAQAIGRSTYPANAVAASEVVVLSWPTTLWQTFVREYPGFADQIYATVGHRLHEMNTLLTDMSTLHVEQRIARALSRLVRQAGRRVEEGIEISFPMTRQDVSEMTGTTLHTVSRLLSAWERDGIILSQRKRIIVCDPHRLTLLGEA